jgi:hypothetical protein
VPSKRPVLRQQRRKAAARAARARVVPAEFLDEFGVDADYAVTALDAGLAKGNPGDACWRAQKDASASWKRHMIVLPRANEQENHSQHGAAAASRFLPNARYPTFNS